MGQKKGYKFTKKHKNNISKALTGRQFSEEHKAKLKKANFGRHHTKETKEKMSFTHTGKPITNKQKEGYFIREIKNKILGVCNNKIGRKVGIEQKLKTSKKLKGIIFTKEHRKKIGLANRIAILKYLESLGHDARFGLGKYEKEILDRIETQNEYKIIRQFKIRSLGYITDGYCKETNTVYEVDEPAHFDIYGNLREKDLERQKSIEEELNCNFIRIKC